MPTHENLATALAAFQAELPKLTRDEKANPNGGGKKWSYAGLDQVSETLQPVLGKHGLSFASRTTWTEKGQFVLEACLLHESGEKIDSFWPLPDPLRVGPQDLGSAMTYGRRYMEMALTGTFPGGEDDDGQKAQASVRQAFDQHRRGVNHADDPAPVSAPPAPPKTWTDDEVREQHAKLTQLSMDKAGKLYDWMAGKGLHNREVFYPDRDVAASATQVIALRIADEAMLPDAGRELISAYRDFAEGRGLLKVQVSATETLDQALHEARELAEHAAIEEAQGTPLHVGGV